VGKTEEGKTEGKELQVIAAQMIAPGE